MCGIAGLLTDREQVPDPAWVKAMCDRMAHRGPDAAGYFLEAGVGLGHRRLSIIDVAGGDQPLGNEDGAIQVVFNGEIYNYLELRRGLAERGHRFTTRSDTEVLVHLYEEVGERLPEYLNGMFALALWDGRRNALFLARDRFGKKPLYYSSAIRGTHFAFASELTALAALPGFQKTISERAVADFLALSYVPDPETIYKNVFKLRPGHSLTVTQSGESQRRYWEPPFSMAHDLDLESTVEEVRTLAADAVERRMMSDVPLGAFLSGGVDSSYVVASMARKTGCVKTFTIGSTNNRFDERHFARAVVESAGTEHYEKVVTPSVEEIFGTLVERFDEPFGDSSAIPTLYLARMTRQHVTVALSGDGADEVFGGYRRYYFGVLEEKLRERFPGWFRRSVIHIAGRCYPKLDYAPQVLRAKTLLTNVSQELADAYFTSMSVFRDGGLDAVLGPEMRAGLAGYDPRAWFRGEGLAFRDLPPLEQMQALDFRTYLPGDILVKVDRATMAYSLEARAPWLDYRFAELAGRMPSSFKRNGRIGKYIFKQAARPYVPEAVITRRKMGFSVPLADWFRSSLKPVFESVVLENGMAPFLNLAEARRLWREHQGSRHDHARKLWNLLMLASWHNRRYAGA